MGKKAYVDIDEVILWILALLSLAVIIIVIFIFKGGGENLINKIINLFRFG